MIQREIRKKTRTKRKRKKETNYRLQKKSHVVSALKEKVKTNCQDPLSRRKR